MNNPLNHMAPSRPYGARSRTLGALSALVAGFALVASAERAAAQYFESESLTINNSSKTVDVVADTHYSNGSGNILRATVVGDSVTFLVPNVAAGTYEVSVGMKRANSRGQFQLSASRADQNTYTNIGPVVDEYVTDGTNAEADFMAVNVGQWSPGTTNDKLFKLTVTGKNSASSQYWLSIDYIVLTPNSVYSVASSSIPAPTGSGVMVFEVMNGTGGAYANNQIYWGILGQNPANNNAWSYLDVNGNVQPISAALNNAAGHLTKNGVNYANIYSTISQKQWISLPKLSAARMYISVGSPCYITTYDTGFAGPNIDNPTDPNYNVYFDFVEFTLDSGGYHGNTTRVDMFGFPVQHRLVAAGFDQAVGEYEWKTRSGLFSSFQSQVPSQFTSLATVQAPYRIVAPIHGSFAAGQPNANYFAGYSSISTHDILLGVGGAADPNTCAAINRHVFTQAQSTWGNIYGYYLTAPANYYSWFWHRHAINELAYGFCYDDVNQQAAYFSQPSPKGLIIRVGW